jgi:hypothetical protein
MKQIQQGQVTIFEYMAAVENQKRLSVHGGDCFRCVFYESHRCRSNWNKPCPDGMQFEEYTGSKVKQCLLATIEVFQDGYMHCPVIDCYGCEHCMERLRADKTLFRYEASQNWDRVPKWKQKK